MKLRILVPGTAVAHGLKVSAGDVLEVADDDPIALALLGAGAAEQTDLPESPFPEPIPAGTPAEFGPSTENVGGHETNFEPLPVGEPAPGAEAPDQATDDEGNTLDQQVEYTGPTDVTDDTDEDEGTGTGPYEGRTVEQLRALATKRGVAVSGSKADLIERLRG